ncbi:MAG TPA: acyltransferase family protein [Gemmatimonadaceae bacterium]
MDAAASTPTLRRDIEGLRAVAILLVVAFHAGVPGFGGGFIGVDVFFVLSGYLITGLLIREYEQRGGIRLADFYARRIRRLLPASCAVLIATIIASRIIYSPLEQVGFASTSTMTALYSSNLWFAKAGVDYLAPSVDENPLLHTWSLAVEEQFYVVWPFLILLAMRLQRSRRRVSPGAVIGVAGLISLGLSLWLTRKIQPWAFFGMPTRGWEFAIGGLGALIPASFLADRTRSASLMMFVGLLGTLLSALLITRHTAFPGVAALAPTVATGLVLVAGAALTGGVVKAFLSSAPMRWIGQRSYSWYLWHWPVLVIGAAAIGSPSLGARLGLALASLAAAAITYVVIENPIRYSRGSAQHPRWTIAAAAFATMLVTTGAMTWHGDAKRAYNDPSQRRFFAAAEDGVDLKGCHLSITETRAGKCDFANVSADSTVVLFGDSHALQWFPALQAIASRRGWRLVSLTKSGCPSADVGVFMEHLGRVYTECNEWRRETLQRIVAMRPTMVLIANSSGYFSSLDGSDPDTKTSLVEWGRGLARTIAAITNAGARVTVIHDTPWPGKNIPTCLARAAWRGQRPETECSFSRAGSIDTLGATQERRIARQNPRVSLVDLSDAVCATPICRPTRDSTVLYADRDHLTAHFIRDLTATLADRLEMPEAVDASSSQHPSLNVVHAERRR